MNGINARLASQPGIYPCKCSIYGPGRLTASERVEAVLGEQPQAPQLLAHALSQQPVQLHRVRPLPRPAAGRHGSGSARRPAA